MKPTLTLLLLCLITTITFSQVGTWTPIATTAPHGSGGGMLLLSDGSVLVKSNSGGGSYGNIYDKLTPNSSGSYINGTWSSIAPMINTRLYYSSQVLKDGRVYVAGGEYGTGGSSGEVYNPLTNTWTAAPAPGATLSDANSEILEDGRILQALVSGNLTGTKIYDPVSNTYANGPTALGIHNESAWVKLPDNSILYVNRLSTSSERYIPATNSWIADATVPVQLYDPYGDETGGGLLLPDGRALFLGSSGHNAYYTPSGSTAPGTWMAAPDFPNAQGTPDAPCAMMINGKVLCDASPVPTSSNHFPSPTTFYEFDPVTNVFTAISAPGGGATLNSSTYVTCFLNLPDGRILYSLQGSSQYYVYTPVGSPVASGKPTITSVTPAGTNTYHISGTLFNGISEGASYGDDWQMNSNYPIVRLTNGSNVYYCRTSNWNSTGVMRGSATDDATFTTPASLPNANYSLYVVANGIASDPISFSPNATASVSIAITSGSNPSCAGASVTFTATPTNGGTTPAYQWKVDGTNAGTNSPTFTTTTLTNGQVVNCIMTSNLPNVQGNPATSNNITMTITTPIPAAVSIGASATTICAGASVTFTATPTNGGSSPTYQWTVNGANAGTNSPTFITSSLTNGQVVACTMTSNSTCITTTIANSNNITMTVNPLPTVSFSGLAASYDISDPAATLTGSPSGGVFSGAGISGNTFTPSSAGVGTFTITYTYSNGCSNTSSQQTTVTNVNCTKPATPGAITGQTSGVCSSTKTYSISAVANATSYSWTVPAGATISSGQGSKTINVAFTNGFTTGNISVAAVNSCGSSGTSGITVTGAPAQPGTISGPASVCANQNNVNYSIASVPGATSYTWTVPAGTLIRNGQGSTGIKVKFGTTGGNITVKANNSCGSGNTSSLAVAITCPGPNNNIPTTDFTSNNLPNKEITISLNPELNIFPNPFKDNTTIRFSLPESGNANISISDLNGRKLMLLYNGKVDGGIINSLSFDGSKLSEGIYIVTLETRKGERITKKLIIAR